MYMSLKLRDILQHGGSGQNFHSSIWKHAMPEYEWNGVDSGGSTDSLVSNKVSCDIQIVTTTASYI